MPIPPRAPQTPQSDSATPKKKRRARKPRDSASKTPPMAPEAAAAAPPSSVQYQYPVDDTHFESSQPVNTPGKAYAGPTFHHSPAPGSLPVPKYFSKSVPAPRTAGLQAMLEEDDGSAASSPGEENHLQRLFRADREEKARKQPSRSDDHSDNDSTPESQKDMFFFSEPESPVRNLFSTPASSSRPRINKAVSDDLFSMDMEKKSLSPPTVPPTPTTLDDAGLQAKLRQYLFQSPSPQASPIPVARQPYGPVQPSFHPTLAQSPIPQKYQKLQTPPSHTPSPHFSTPPPKAPQFRRPEYVQPSPQRTPLRPVQAAKQPCAPSTWDIVDMENSLRKILKLDAIAPSRPGVML